MARRRYISTDISTDTAVNRLAVKSDFAALLYTWMIPHCGDDACIPADAEEILLMVMPGRRDKTPDDIEEALRLMQDFGLIHWEDNGKSVNYPAEAFYKYQSYIKDGERRGAHNTADQRTEETISAKQRKTAQNDASFSFKSSVSSSSSVSSPSSSTQEISPKPKRKSRLPDDWMPSDKQRSSLADSGFSVQEIDAETIKFKNYHLNKGDTGLAWDRAFANWMDNSRSFAKPKANAPNGTKPFSPYRFTREEELAAIAANPLMRVVSHD